MGRLSKINFIIETRSAGFIISQSKGGKMMPLSFGSEGTKYRLARVNGKEALSRHLKELGFVEGEEIELLHNDCGAITCALKGSRLCLGASVASLLEVVAI